MHECSPLEQERLRYQPKLPPLLADPCSAALTADSGSSLLPPLPDHFPHIGKQPRLFVTQVEAEPCPARRVGVVLSGGQAAGGHNVITGLFDALKKQNHESKLFGFLNGPKGILDNQSVELTEENLAGYRNQGGFDLLGSGREKIETKEQLVAASKTVSVLQLDGLLVIGGDDSNTNAALLAEFFASQKIECCVIGAPKTIDGDLRSEDVEVSFGFDTAAKVFSEAIGSIARDCLSAKK